MAKTKSLQKKRKDVEVQVDMDNKTLKFLKSVSKLSGRSIDDVVNVLLAARLVAEK